MIRELRNALSKLFEFTRTTPGDVLSLTAVIKLRAELYYFAIIKFQFDSTVARSSSPLFSLMEGVGCLNWRGRESSASINVNFFVLGTVN